MQTSLRVCALAAFACVARPRRRRSRRGPAADLPRGAEAGSRDRGRALAVGGHAGARAAGARGAPAARCPRKARPTPTTTTRRSTPTPKITISQNYGYGNLVFSASQPLYRPQNVVALDQAREQVTQSDFTLGIAQQDLIIRTTVAYFDVLLAEFNVELAEQQKIAVSEQLAQAKRNFEVGTATITDTNEAQAKYDQIIATEIQARNDLDRRRTALTAIIGRMPKNLKRVGRGFEPGAAGSQQPRLLGRPRAAGEPVRCASRSRTTRSPRSRSTARAPGHLPTLDAGRERDGADQQRLDRGRHRRQFALRPVRHRAQRADLHRRLRQFARARDDLAAGQVRAPTSSRPSALAVDQRAGRLLGRQQRGGGREGVRAGGRVGGGRAAVEHPGTGGRHPHQPRRAQRAAERVLDAARPRQRVLHSTCSRCCGSSRRSAISPSRTSKRSTAG